MIAHKKGMTSAKRLPTKHAAYPLPVRPGDRGGPLFWPEGAARGRKSHPSAAALGSVQYPRSTVLKDARVVAHASRLQIPPSRRDRCTERQVHPYRRAGPDVGGAHLRRGRRQSPNEASASERRSQIEWLLASAATEGESQALARIPLPTVVVQRAWIGVRASMRGAPQIRTMSGIKGLLPCRRCQFSSADASLEAPSPGRDIQDNPSQRGSAPPALLPNAKVRMRNFPRAPMLLQTHVTPVRDRRIQLGAYLDGA